MADNFRDIKAGDKVILSNNGTESIATVEKVTPTGRIKINGNYYNSDNGYMIGSGVWCRGYIIPYTEERAETIRRERTVSRCLNQLRKLRTEDIDYDTAVRILNILNEKAKDTKENSDKETVDKEDDRTL